MTPASTANSIITRRRHAHQSWAHVAPPIDNTSGTTTAHAAYDFLCDTAVVVKNIVQGASKNKHCNCTPLLNNFIHILLRYDMKE